ncbi:MAG: sporulation protein YunB [Clostridia bacterium]|nr:sporulation protein YunB [Clostridia bacterium]
MKKKTKKRKFILFIVLVLTLAIVLYFFSTKLLLDLGEANYSGMLSSASYYAINKSLENKITYEDLITIEKDDNDKITMIKTDAYKFNSLTSKIADGVSEFLSAEIEKGVAVPIGAFTGIKMFAGFGKKVNMPLLSIPSVKCDVISSFESVGINQTRHSLYVDIVPEVYIVTRFKTRDLTDKITILIFDNFITGEVPEMYFAGKIFSSYKEL